MKYLLPVILLVGYATVAQVPIESGRWEFDDRLTRQSIYDKNGGLKPIKGIDGDIYVGSRHEYHFNRKIYDFDKNELILVGYLDNGEYETEKIVPIKVLKSTFDYLIIETVN